MLPILAGIASLIAFLHMINVAQSMVFEVMRVMAIIFAYEVIFKDRERYIEMARHIPIQTYAHKVYEYVQYRIG